MAEMLEDETRLTVLVQEGVAKDTAAFSPQARKAILALSDVEFQSVLSIRKTVLSVVGADAVRQHDECMSFVF